MNVQQYYNDNYIDATNEFIGGGNNNIISGGTSGDTLNNYIYLSSNSNLVINNSNQYGLINFKTLYNYYNGITNGTYINYDGRLYVYHDYKILQPLVPSGYLNVEDELAGLKQSSLVADGEMIVVQAEIAGINTSLLIQEAEIEKIGTEIELHRQIISTLVDYDYYEEIYNENVANSLTSITALNDATVAFIRKKNLIEGVLGGISFVALSGFIASIYEVFELDSIKSFYSNANSNILNNTERQPALSNLNASQCNNYINLGNQLSNLSVEKGFINSKITNQQFIPELKSDKILLGNITTPNVAYQMEMTGDLNLNMLYLNSTSLTSLLNQKQGNLTFNNPLLNTIDIITLKKDSSLTLDGSGNLSVAPSTASKWTTSGTNIYNNNTGNVGIGINTPTFKLDVNGSVNISKENNVFIFDAGTDKRLGLLKTFGSFPKFCAAAGTPISFCHLNSGNLGQTITNYQAHTDRLTIASDGNVGIGISPSYKLDVNGTLNCSGNFTGGGNDNIIANNTDGGVSLKVRNNSTGTSAYALNGVVNSSGIFAGIFLNSSSRTADGGINTATIRNDAGDLRLSAKLDTPYIYLKNSSGNVGIGSMIPQYKLDVIGDINFTGSLRQNGVIFTSGTSQWTTSGTSIYYNGGNVGVGNANPLATLHVSGTIACINAAIWDHLRLFHDGTTAYFDAGGAENGIAFRTENGGSSYPASSYTERLRIANNGNIGINNSSPIYNLDIFGSTAFDGTCALRLYNTASQYGRTQLHLVGRYENNNDAWSLTGGRNAIMFGLQSSLNTTINYKYAIQNFANSLGFICVDYSTSAPAFQLLTNGDGFFAKRLVVSGASVAVPSNYMTTGSLSVGSVNTNYGGGSGWSGNTSCIMLECLDGTEIAVHDSGHRVSSLLYYEGGVNHNIYIGRNMGWDKPYNIYLSCYYLAFSLQSWYIGVGNPNSIPNSLMFIHDTGTLYSKWWFNGQQNGTSSEISDIRIKKDIKEIDNAFEKLLKIKPKEYLLCEDKDENKKFGIIAQDIEKEDELKDFIFKEPDYIANILCNGEYIKKQIGETKPALDPNINYEKSDDNPTPLPKPKPEPIYSYRIKAEKELRNLIDIDDEIKIVFNNNDDANKEIIIDDTPYNNRYKRRFVKVKGFIDDFTIEINGDLDIKEQDEKALFIYGKKVNDFLKLDYQSLYCLNIKATQELIIKTNSQEKILQAQQRTIEELLIRLARLENKLF